jgi:hypothetical protein
LRQEASGQHGARALALSLSHQHRLRVALQGSSASLSVREDRLLAHIDRWLSKLFNLENIEATVAAIVTPDSEARREDPEVARARITLVESERKLAKHLDGLEAGFPTELVAPRIAAARREKAAAEAVLASAPPTPQPLALDEVIETLSMLRDLPELLGAIEQADRAALYQALGLHVTYRRVGAVEQVRLRTSLRAVKLERVGGRRRGSATSSAAGCGSLDNCGRNCAYYGNDEHSEKECQVGGGSPDSIGKA